MYSPGAKVVLLAPRFSRHLSWKTVSEPFARTPKEFIGWSPMWRLDLCSKTDTVTYHYCTAVLFPVCIFLEKVEHSRDVDHNFFFFWKFFSSQCEKEKSIRYEVHCNQNEQTKLFLRRILSTLGIETSEIFFLLVHIKTILLCNVVDMIKCFTNKSPITSSKAGCIDQSKRGFYRNKFLKYLKWHFPKYGLWNISTMWNNDVISVYLEEEVEMNTPHFILFLKIYKAC